MLHDMALLRDSTLKTVVQLFSANGAAYQRLLHYSAIVIQQRGDDASTILSRNLLRLYSISDETRLLRFSSSLLLSESLESS